MHQWNQQQCHAGVPSLEFLSMARLFVLTLLVAAVALPSAQGRVSAAPACKGSNLSGSFTVIRGSAGAGNIVYKLRLRNASAATCFVTGIPGLRLLARNGSNLPTHATPANRGALTAVKVRLQPGKAAKTTARFSPDVPGPGEGGVKRQCEPTAYKLRVTPNGGGSVVVAVTPPTPVCSHGVMTLPALSAA
jgi:hypothetical protein